MITENVSTLKIHRLTQEQYDRELAAGRLDANAIYLTPDEGVDFTGYATEQYVDNATAAVKDEILNGADEAYDTLKELGELIEQNKGAIEAFEALASGKADKEHTHEIKDVTGLQTALDGKANVEHGLHVEFSDVAPTMAGEAFVGVASTVARSDHRHATDTTRASVDQLNSAVNRLQNVETKQDSFLEVSEEDINALFA